MVFVQDERYMEDRHSNVIITFSGPDFSGLGAYATSCKRLKSLEKNKA